MSVRAPILLTSLLVALVAVIAMPGDPEGLLLLTPALALLLPLLLGSYPGEGSVERLSAWFSKVRLPEARKTRLSPVFCCEGLSAGLAFSAANGSRGPPRLAL